MANPVFIGRDAELRHLEGLFARAAKGKGQIVFVVGEAGTGKTTLVQELARRTLAGYTDSVIAVGNCNAQTGLGDPYLPFREILGLLLGNVGTPRDHSSLPQENTNRLRKLLVRSTQVLVEVGPDLVGVFVPGAALVATIGKAVVEKVGWMEELERLTRRKQERALLGEAAMEQTRLFEQYTSTLIALSQLGPLLVVVDDLHWADAASISLLFHLARRIEESRILLVGTYRPDEVALGRGGARHPLETVVNELRRYHGDVTVDLDRAVLTEGRSFVDELLDLQSNRLPEAFRGALFQHTGGHPLFTRELLRTMIERGDLQQDEDGRWFVASSLEWNTLPSRVEGVIAERIGRLEEEARTYLCVASVEGMQFTGQVIASVEQVGERQLLRELARLEKQHRLVREDGEERVNQRHLSRYGFAHALFQHYLIESLGTSERRLLHGEVAGVLEELHGAEVGEIAVSLAWHYEEAGITDKAIAALLQAAHRALQLSAHREAIVHLTRALELLTSLPDDPYRLQQELQIQMMWGAAHTYQHGFAAPAVESAYTRAHALCLRLGDVPELVPVLVGLHAFYIVRGKIQNAIEIADQVGAMAEATGDSTLELVTNWLLGAARFWQGDFESAHQHSERACAIYNPDQHRSLAYLYANDPGVVSRAYNAYALWYLGYPDTARARAREAIELAENLGHPWIYVYALTFSNAVALCRRDWQAVVEGTDRLLSVANKEGYGFWAVLAMCHRGWALALLDHSADGMALMAEGLKGYRAAGANLAQGFNLSGAAEGYASMSALQEALHCVERGLAVVRETGERASEAELYRLRGELLWTRGGDAGEAEAQIQHALVVAQHQKARSLELRAAMSLVRLHRVAGTREQAERARELLGEVYGRFTEGFDTADLKQARAMLEESF